MQSTWGQHEAQGPPGAPAEPGGLAAPTGCRFEGAAQPLSKDTSAPTATPSCSGSCSLPTIPGCVSGRCSLPTSALVLSSLPFLSPSLPPHGAHWPRGAPTSPLLAPSC